MTELRRSFYDYLREVPNPAPDGKTKGTEREFRHYAHEMTQVALAALAHTGVEMVEYDVRGYSPHISTRLKEIERRSTYPEVKRNLGKNEVNPRKDDGKKEENHE